MTVHVYVYENTETTLWFESLVVCEGGPWQLIREYDKEIPDPVGPGGTTDYNQLSNRPQINSVLLSGNKTSQQLKIESSIPPGGTAGQVLTKKSATDGDADWQTPTGGATSWDQITGKPTDLVQDAEYQHTDNNYTTSDKDKLASLENYDDTALADRVSANETAIADRYTKTEDDALLADKADKATTYTKTETDAALADKQDTLESGVSIKTVNGNSLLGEGNIDIGGGGGNANFDIGTVPLGGAGVYEVNAFLSNNDSERVRATYSRGVNGGLPDWFTMSVTSGLGTDDFEVSTRGYTEQKAAQAQNNAQTYADLKLTQKQDKLVSGTNIKTVNGNSLLGDGNIEIGGGGTVDTAMSDTSENAVQNKVIKTYVDNIQGLPGGGTNGQILARNSMSPENAEWIDNPVGTHFEIGAEKWYGTYTDNGVTYQVYSKLLDIGALPSAAGAAQYPHGITGINQILQISGFTNDGFVMNAPRQNAQDNISIYQAQKSGNIVIEVGKDRSSKTGFVMLIYAKNN